MADRDPDTEPDEVMLALPADGDAHRSTLLRLASQVARVAGWSVDLRTNEVRWSAELYELLAWPLDRPPTLDEGLAMYRDPQTVLVALARCAADGQRFDIEVELADEACPVRFARIVGEAQRGPDGRVAWLAGAFQDISERRLREAEADLLHLRLSQLLDATSDGVVLLDEADVVTFVNPSAVDRTGVPRERFLGRRLWDAFPDAEHGPVHRAVLEARASGAPTALDGYYYPALATWFDLSALPSADGVAIVFRDVGGRIAEVQRLARLARDEQAAADRLRDLDRLKNSFLSAVSHELRTPLTIVQGMSETLQRMRERISDTQREIIEDALVVQSQRLGRLLGELLDVDRLARGELRATPRRGDVVPIVAETAREVADAHVELRLDVPDRLEAVVDGALVERIVTNLVGNARKYAAGATVLVRLCPLEAYGCRIEVIDDGPGIPEQELDAVFQPLYRRADDDPKPGTGVGLALVRAFAELHGGGAWALPHDDGAHLRVDLPGAAPDTASGQPGGSNAP